MNQQLPEIDRRSFQGSPGIAASATIFLICSPARFWLGPMKRDGRYRLVLVTAPDLRTARKLAHAALKARLIACANLVPAIESHYWWRGRMEHSNEVLLFMKTTTARLGRLEALIVTQHPYDTPEFIALELSGGNRKYLEWWKRSCG